MKPYRLKHKPTGLYYQPGKNNLSKNGKVYFTARHGLSEAINRYKLYPGTEYQYFPVFAQKSSNKNSKANIQLLTNNILFWEDYRYGGYEIVAKTKLTDWVVEEL